MKKLILTLCVLTSLNCYASSKIYIDHEDLDDSKECFHISVGKNEWLSTNIIYRDKKGLYAKEEELLKVSDLDSAYKQSWKCPYCHCYYDIGTACDNADCPSKYPTKK